MIKAILFVIGFLLLAATIGLIVYFGRKYYLETDKYEDPKEALDKAYEKEKDRITSRYGWNYEANDDCTRALAKLDEKYQEQLSKLKDMPDNSPKTGGLSGSIIAFLALLAFVITIPGSFHQVEAGTYAVVKQVGRIVDVKTPGTYFDFYMTKKYETYDATVQQVKINTAAYSNDGQTMDLEVYLQYQIQLDKLIVRDDNGNIIQTDGIAGKYVTLESLQARIETQCIEKTKAVMSSAEAMTIIQSRTEYSNQVSTAVRDVLSDPENKYYVNVHDVVLTNIDFTDEFEKSVEDKVVAEQQKAASITKAEADLEVAKLEAQRKIEEAKGDAEAQVIQAEGAARAASSKIIDLARSLGYTVETKYAYKTTTTIEHLLDRETTLFDDTIKTERISTTLVSRKVAEDAPTEVKEVLEEVPQTTYVELGRTKVSDTEVDIKTEATTTLRELASTNYRVTDVDEDFQVLVEEYLKYLAYLEQWNGELPKVVSSDGALSIIIPNA